MANSSLLKSLALEAMNAVNLAGSIFVKAPQVYNIWSTKSVAGIAENAFIFEAVGLGCGVVYNILRRFPFSTWGELLFLWI